MSGRRTRFAARLAGPATAAAVLVAGASAAAAPPGAGLRQRAHRLDVQAQKLDSRTHQALLQLYALQSRLGTARTRLSALEARSASLRAEQAALAQQLAAARATLTVSQRDLGAHLRSLYEQGNIDPLAVVLGSQSLDEALTRLDDLTRLADQSRRVVAVTLDARARLVRVRAALATQRRRVDRALAQAHAAEADLANASSQRLAYVSQLRAQRQLARTQIADLLVAAKAAETKSQQLTAAAAAPAPGASPSSPAPTQPGETTTAAAAPVPAPAQPGRTLRVSATGYSLPGHTASGLPVGWGIVAVDPNVIPLGTRMSVPGYGEAVAADVGSAVRGNDIDLWFPTLAQARAWGRRTVVITLH